MPAGPFVLLKAAREALQAAALDAFPDEACGFLIGARGTTIVSSARAQRNVHPGPRTTRYRIDGLEYVRLEDELEASGDALLGIFHSHPRHPPIPSETDREVAWPGLLYFIQSVPGPGAIGDLRAWAVRELNGAFEPVHFVTQER